MPKKQTLCLYGTGNDGIPVCMFFAKKSDLKDFKRIHPGKYDVLKLRGIGYNDFTVRF